MFPSFAFQLVPWNWKKEGWVDVNKYESFQRNGVQFTKSIVLLSKENYFQGSIVMFFSGGQYALFPTAFFASLSFQTV